LFHLRATARKEPSGETVTVCGLIFDFLRKKRNELRKVPLMGSFLPKQPDKNKREFLRIKNSKTVLNPRGQHLF